MIAIACALSITVDLPSEKVSKSQPFHRARLAGTEGNITCDSCTPVGRHSSKDNSTSPILLLGYFTKAFGFGLVFYLLAGCAAIPTKALDNSYGYTPLAPTPASLTSFDLPADCGTNLLDNLPNEAMHLSVAQTDAKLGVTYGPATITDAGSNYTVVLDYIKSATEPFPMVRQIDVSNHLEWHTNFIPIYAGVGFRLIATLHANTAGLNLGNLSAIGVAADTHQITGQLSIQLMGLSGPEITSALPIPTDISSATIQSTLVAMGTIKSKIYDDKTTKKAQIVGFENIYGTSISDLNIYVSSLLEKAANFRLSLALYGKNGVEQSNYVTIFKFWTPSSQTKYDIANVKLGAELTEDVRKKLSGVEPYYLVDDLEDKIVEFRKKLEHEGVAHYDYYATQGKGTSTFKHGYTWEATIGRDHPIDRDQFIKIYADFWRRDDNIWLEELSVSSFHDNSLRGH